MVIHLTSLDLIEPDALEQGLLRIVKYGSVDLVVNMDSSTVVSYLKTDMAPWNVRAKVKRI